MTDPSGGSLSPQHDCSSSFGSHSSSRPVGRQSSSQQRRPLDQSLSNVVDVLDPSRLLECSQLERQLRFQHVVRRYISQIMFGCTSPVCTTPTCLSCNERLIARPFRGPTELTARALAHYLASQDNPHKGLCPHSLRISPSALEIAGADGIAIRRSAGRGGQVLNVFPAPDTFVTTNDSASKLVGSDGVDQKNRNYGVDGILASLDGQRQKKKDVKSLGQNLFDTMTVIFSLSKSIPSPLSVFAALRSPYTPRQSSSDLVHADRLIANSDQGGRVASNDAASALDVRGHALPSHADESAAPMQAALQHTQQSIRSAEPSAALLDSENLNTGQRIHRIRHHLRDRAGNRRPSFKTQNATHLDGTQENLASRPAGMRARPSMLDIHNPLGLNPAVLSPIPTAKEGHLGTRSVENGPILPVASRLDCKLMDQLKEEVYHDYHEYASNLSPVVDYDTARRDFRMKPFVNRSIYFTLSDPETLLQSFRDEGDGVYKNSPLPHLNSCDLVHSFRDWNRRNGALIFDSLWIATKALFTPPPELDVQKSPRLKASRRSPSADESSEQADYCEGPEASASRYLSDDEAAHIIVICIHALTSLVDVGWPHTWVQLRKFRSWGIILPDAPPRMEPFNEAPDPWIEIIDSLEYEPALRLTDRLLRGIGARRCFEKILATLDHQDNHAEQTDHVPPGFRLLDILVRHLIEVEQSALTRAKAMKGGLDCREDPGWTVTATFMEWLRTIIIKKWDGKSDVNRWSSVGTAMTLLDEFHSDRDSLNLRTHMFYMPYLNERLDPVDEPAEFLKREKQPNSFHIFEYPCLFPPEYVVAYFRTINLTAMYKHFERTERAWHLQRELAPFVREPYEGRANRFMKVTLSDYLVLDVSREHVLEETLNQLWGLETRALLKPLKVRMGTQGGEVGQDQGGVTYEFFCVVLSEAFKSDTGMFTVDPETRMTWFQPASLEPDWKFEMLGILFSLAIYNGITLPVTFPRALYRNLLAPSHPCIPPTYPGDLAFIRDGWPGLAKSFEDLLSWDDGDVADVFVRSYSFSFEAFGQKIDVDMQAFEGRRWPADTGQTFENTQHPALNNPAWEYPTSEIAKYTGGILSPGETDRPTEAPLVTNANRDKFVSDYIYWLTHKSVASQILAFRKGFRACLKNKALHLFDPISLKALVEGTQTIDVAALKMSTRYEEGYHISHDTIIDFWAIVEDFSMEDRRKLLEFVTASERVPITGFDSMNFYIVRQGPDTEMLPTSSTCFGKLMLPEYENKEKLKRKLELAIQYSKGFGVV